MKRLTQAIVLGVVIPVLMFSVSSIALGEESEYGKYDEALGGVVSHGIVHNIARDRRVIKTAGLWEPEGVDKYMKRHFDALSTKIDKLGNQIKSMERKMGDMTRKMDNMTKAAS
jgi:hypothetical protein